MKPSQIAMLGDLAKCWLGTIPREWLSWVLLTNTLPRADAIYLRWLHNKYRMQIRAIRKNAKRGEK